MMLSTHGIYGNAVQLLLIFFQMCLEMRFFQHLCLLLRWFTFLVIIFYTIVS